MNTNMLRKTGFKLFKRRIRLHVLSRLSPKVTFSRLRLHLREAGKNTLFCFILFCFLSNGARVLPAFSGQSTFLASGRQAWDWTTKIALSSGH